MSLRIRERFKRWWYHPTIDEMQAEMLREVRARTRQYSFTLAIDGGAPLDFRIKAGRLPRGLLFDESSGTLYGHPCTPEDYIRGNDILRDPMPSFEDAKRHLYGFRPPALNASERMAAWGIDQLRAYEPKYSADGPLAGIRCNCGANWCPDTPLAERFTSKPKLGGRTP